VRSFYVLEEEVLIEKAIGPIRVITADGEVDYAACPELRTLMAETVKPDCVLVIVDLTRATFIDSTAIGLLVNAATKLQELNRRMVIVCGEEQILNIFQIVGLEEIVDIYDSRELALERIASVA
jgi:anti-anti-sigma factor